MSLHAQALLDVHEELIVDLFAGGGGASSGIEEATGRMVDIAINHNPVAVSLHEANHPQTIHFKADVFEVCPKEVAQGRPIGLLWASPDCTFHSKARGKAPIRHANKKRRALAWVVTRWAAQVQPKVIMLENVEEFAQWGPLIGRREHLRPCPRRRGKTFRKWVNSLRVLGYKVEWRELKACDYGAPTIRKRLFVIARRDGNPIVWPEPTHGPGRAKPWRAVAECIDWSLPMCSIFATKEEAKAWGVEHGQAAPIRPLADNTMRRVARGVKRFVIDNPKPYLVTIAHGEGSGTKKRWGDGTGNIDNPGPTVMTKNQHALVVPITVNVANSKTTGRGPNTWTATEPARTITAANGTAIVAANLATYHDEKGAEARGANLLQPIHTIDTANRHALVASFLGQNNGGFYEGEGKPITEPCSTVLANSRGHFPVIAAHIQRDFGTSTGHKVDEPVGTITGDGGGKAGLVASFLAQYNGTADAQSLDEPSRTIPTVDRFGLVTVDVKGVPHVIVDIAMRMLQPKELYLAQGFRPGYIIDRTADGTPITKSEQVKMVGNSVCPPLAKALATANCAWLIIPSRRVA